MVLNLGGIVVQAAQRMAEAASAHANDDTYESPYTQEALKRGFDIPWWQKVLGTRFTNGSLQLASLRVSAHCALLPELPLGLMGKTVLNSFC